MTCNFRVGQKVVLVRDFTPDQRSNAPGDGIILPEMGVVYTIREIGLFEGEPMVWLDEVVNTQRFYLDIFEVMEQGFDATRFRPVVEHETDISIFKALLTPSKEKVETAP